jgi:hypothetical protein
MSGWIGVDLDGTLARYDGWKGIEHVGEPIPAMLNRVKKWLAEGREVKIFTARMACEGDTRREVIQAIHDWCVRNGLPKLQITNVKDFAMIELYDDRCVQVEMNTGRLIGERT